MSSPQGRLIASAAIASLSAVAWAGNDEPASAVAPVGVPVYTVASLTPGTSAAGLGVNATGDVAGWITVNGFPRPILRTPENGVIVLPTSSVQPYGTARDLSDRVAGVITVVGEARLNSSGSAIHAVRWKVAAPQGSVTVTDLGTLPGQAESNRPRAPRSSRCPQPRTHDSHLPGRHRSLGTTMAARAVTHPSAALTDTPPGRT